MDGGEQIKFIYNEAAVVVNIGGKNHLVIGDLHIGAERKLHHKGIYVYSALDSMIKKIKSLAAEFGAKDIIILGDLKDTILYPDVGELNGLKHFLDEMKGYKMIVTTGNHDAHLSELIKFDMRDELIMDDVAFMHGHKWPSDAAMKGKYIFAGHNHIAISIMDKNKGVYIQKGWLIAKLNKKKAALQYKEFNPDIRIVVLPAFNDLILGMPVNETKEDYLSPLFRNGVFDYKKAEVYSLHGNLVGTPTTLKKRMKSSKK